MDTKLQAVLAMTPASLPDVNLTLDDISAPLTTAMIRETIEQKALSDAEAFVAGLQKFESQISALHDSITSLVKESEILRFHVNAVSSPSGLDAFEAAIKKRDDAKAQLDAVEVFMGKFQITSSTSAALESAVTDHAFLSALAEIGEVYSNLQRAFSSSDDTPNPSSNMGLEMLSSLSSKQESAYEKLYSFVCDRLALTVPEPEDEEEVENAYGDPVVREAVVALKAR